MCQTLSTTWQKLKYRAKVQFADPPSTTSFLNADNTKQIQEVVGILLYYAWAIDSTLLATLDTIATQQAKGTQDTMEAVTQLLNYCATHHDATDPMGVKWLRCGCTQWWVEV